MSSFQSEKTQASHTTQKVVEDVISLSSSKLGLLQGVLDEDTVYGCWASFGAYIAKQFRSGRGVTVPQFGLFSFTSAEINLSGTTNEDSRLIQNREPVFIVSKEFLKGLDYQSALYRDTGLRGFHSASTEGKIQVVKANFMQISQNAQVDRDTCSLSISRVIQKIYDGIKDLNILLKSIEFRQSTKDNQLTSQSLKELLKKKPSNPQLDPDLFVIDQSAKQWLENNLQVQMDEISSNQDKALNTERRSERDPEFLEMAKSVSNFHQTYIKPPQMIGNDILYESASQRNYSSYQSTRGPVINNSNISLNVIQQGQIALSKLKSFLKEREILAEDSYIQLAQSIYGINASSRSELDFDQFNLAFIKMKWNFEQTQIAMMFKLIDKNEQGKINFVKWNEIVYRQKNPLIDIRRVLEKYNFQIPEILRRMGLHQNRSALLNEYDVKSAFKKLDPSLTEQNLRSISMYILRKDQRISIEELITTLCQGYEKVVLKSYEEKKKDQDLLRKIQIELVQRNDPDLLMRHFEEFDDQNSGRLDVSSFKTCLLKAQLNLSLNDLNIISKSLQKDSENTVDYQKFNNQVANSLNGEEFAFTLEDFVEKLKSYMSEHSMDFRGLFDTFLMQNYQQNQKNQKENNKRLTIDFFFNQIIKRRIFYDEKQMQVLQYVQLIDVDKDGLINLDDFQAFLQQYMYLEDQKSDMIGSTIGTSTGGAPKVPAFSMNIMQNLSSAITERQSSNPALHYRRSSREQNQNSVSSALNLMPQQSKNYQSTTVLSISQHINSSSSMIQNNQSNEMKQKPLFPTVSLPEQQLQALMRDFQQRLTELGINHYEAFQRFDGNNNGFIDFAEFCQVLDTFIKVSLKGKEGMFSYIDNLRIGMFDYQRFHQVMKQIVFKEDDITKDNWGWQFDMIVKMKQWYRQSGLSIDNAFKLFDSDFDGYMSKNDLKLFLVNSLRIDKDIIQSTKLDRIFKLLDSTKKGKVEQSDIQKLLLGSRDLSLGSDPTSSKSGFLSDRSKSSSTGASAINWFENACQQISNFIQKNYSSLKESYDKIAKGKINLNYRDFKAWIDEHMILNGFNLTQTLMQRLYSYLDPHKKGFISQYDWIRDFQNFPNIKEMNLQPISEAIASTFQSAEEAFKYLQHAGGVNGMKLSFLGGQSQIISQEEIINGIQNESQIFGNQNLKFEIFSEGISRIVGNNIYQKQDILNLWNKIMGLTNHTGNEMDLLTFQNYFVLENVPFLNKPAVAVGATVNNAITYPQLASRFPSDLTDQEMIEKTISQMQSQRTNSTLNQSNQSSNRYINHMQVFQKAQGLFSVSHFDLRTLFREVDSQSTGFVNTREMRNILLRNNFGLTGNQIDVLINYSTDPYSTDKINWKSFLKKLTPSESEILIKERTKEQLKKMKVAINHFLISPKDAFREVLFTHIQTITQKFFQQFDSQKTGQIYLDDFNQIIQKLSYFNSEDLPSMLVIKDLFEFIDIKSDGYIDIDEWTQAFIIDQGKANDYSSGQEPKILEISKLKPIHQNIQISKSLNYGEKFQFKDEEKLSSNPDVWERSQQYDRIIKLLGKNRKVIYDKMKFVSERENQSSNGLENRIISISTAKQIIEQYLKESGIHVHQKCWPQLLQFSQVNLECLDYKVLLDNYKHRCDLMNSPPTFTLPGKEATS